MAAKRFPDHASGPRPAHINPTRFALYLFLAVSAIAFLFPLFVMVTTSLKTMDEVRNGSIFTLPSAPSLEAWRTAWYSACTGLNCDGIRGGFINSVKILVPSTIVPIALGSITG